MTVYVSTLQVDGDRRYHVITADRNWELRQAAQSYRTRVIVKGNKSSAQITRWRRAENKYQERRSASIILKREMRREESSPGLNTDPTDYANRERERKESSTARESEGIRLIGEPR